MNKSGYIGNENILNIPQKDLNKLLDGEEYFKEFENFKSLVRRRLVGLNYGAAIMVLESLTNDFKDESLKHKLTLL